MKKIILSLLLLNAFYLNAQNKKGTSFNGSSADDVVCPPSANLMSSKDVENLITQMLDKVGLKNRYIIKSCTQVENCQATVQDGKPYILYNPQFLNRVKSLNFTSADLPTSDTKDWETLTILAHELGHHINYHLTNPLPDATQRDMEKEADETAGFLIYLLNGSLAQAQKVYYNENISVEGSFLYPPRSERLAAVAKGYNHAKKLYPNGGGSSSKFVSTINTLLRDIAFNSTINDVLAYEHGEQHRNSITYESLPTATECAPNTVKYYWRYLKDSRYALRFATYFKDHNLQDKFTGDSFLVYAFYENKLVGIGLNLFSDEESGKKLLKEMGQDIQNLPAKYLESENGSYYKAKMRKDASGWYHTGMSFSNATGSTICPAWD
jgi:hypothetical protein